MKFTDILAEINKIPQIPNYIPSLDRIQAAIKERYPDLNKYKSQNIVVAGTNGKGSTVKLLEAFFLANNTPCAVFTSPHLIRINERICLNAKEISDSDFQSSYLEIRPLVKKYNLSHFEILSLVALEYFYPQMQRGLICIWEVGMGGRWDATNAIPHDYSILCPIGLDHQKYLGNSLVEIAANKFDIVQQDNFVFSVNYEQDILQLLKTKVELTNSTWHLCNEDFKSNFKYIYKEPYNYFLEYKSQTYKLALAGPRGFNNSLFALFIWQKLGYELDVALKALSKVSWPHRFSKRYSSFFKRDIYFSGDHNPQGIESLLAILKESPKQKWKVLMAITEGRDPNAMFTPLFTQPNVELVLCQSPFRAQSLEDYKRWDHWEKWNSFYSEEIQTALDHIQQTLNSDENILICGSLYLTGFVDSILPEI